MTTPAFKPHGDCPVPNIPAIAGVLVSSCVVEPPFEPEYCFPFETVPIIPPPSADFGCYQAAGIKAEAHINNCLAIENLNMDIGPGPLSGTLAGNLLAAIGSSALKEALTECNNPVFNAKIDYPNQHETGFCEPRFTLDLGIPCVPIKMEANAITDSRTPQMTITGGRNINMADPNNITMDCSYDFQIGLAGGGTGDICILCNATDDGYGNVTLTFKKLTAKSGFATNITPCTLTKDQCGDDTFPH